MTDGLSPAELCLLRCCADPAEDHATAIESLAPAQVEELEALTLRTRTAGLVAHALTAVPGVSSSAGPRFAELSRSYALQTLEQGRAIAHVVGLLQAAGYTPIALKGVALAFGAYPSPQLRPLRDVDLLLEPEAALAAQEMLLAQPRYRRAAWAGQYGLDHGHQLPEIEDCDSGLVIEIHHRLDAHEGRQDHELLAMVRADTDGIELLGVPMPVPNAHANFLHLLEHASLHHAFANGPLILADFHFLALKHALDWERLEQDCERMGLAHSLQLVVALAHQLGGRWMPTELVERSAPAIPFVLAAMRAMLAEPEQVERHMQRRRLASRSGKGAGAFAALSRALRPDPAQLALLSKRAVDSPWRWTGYPAWLLQKGGRYWLGARDDRSLALSQERDALIDWLGR